ncbi:MAG: hypothetical protein GF364_17885 [Candidatus Lokiarchaeota archaeon]|nr:hypothetical protein [Candidatus Lokiarchaeota archaeon]
MPNNEEISVTVPGRICVFGDKVDLLGKPVIAAAINALMTVKVAKRNDNKISFYSNTLDLNIDFNLDDTSYNYDHPLKYWTAIVNRLKDKITGFSAEVRSDIPIGAGLSSSAAICVSLIKALSILYGLNMNKDEIAELAYVCEHDDLGISCGRMDQYSISYGGVTYIETGDVPKVTELPVESLPIVVGNSKEERKAVVVLNRIRECINQNDPVVLNAFSKIEKIVAEGRDALISKDYKKVGKLMSQQQEQENILQAATDKLNRLCKKAIEAGAFGAKQMGAGGGGCMEAICPGKQNEVKKAIKDAGGEPWVFEIYKHKI